MLPAPDANGVYGATGSTATVRTPPTPFVMVHSIVSFVVLVSLTTLTTPTTDTTGEESFPQRSLWEGDQLDVAMGVDFVITTQTGSCFGWLLKSNKKPNQLWHEVSKYHG